MNTDDIEKDGVIIPESLLDTLERDFNAVMEALSEDESAEHFRVEYEKLFHLLQRSHISEQSLVYKCQELTQELLSNAAKMQAAIKLSQGDHSTIEALKKEIEKAWRTVDLANDKDFRARETVKNLMEEIASLQNILEEGSRIPTDHATIDELKLENKRMQIEIDEMNKNIEKISKETSEALATKKQAETELATNAEEAQRITGRFELVKQEHRREKNAKERAEAQLRDLMVLLRTRENELTAKTHGVAKLDLSIINLRNQIRDDYEKKQSLSRKLETAEKQLFHTKQSVMDTVDTSAELTEKLNDLDRQVDQTVRRTTEARFEIERIQRVRDKDFKEYGRLLQQNCNLKQDLSNMMLQKDQVHRCILNLEKEKARIMEACSMVQKERDAIIKVGKKENKKRIAIEKILKDTKENTKDLQESIDREKNISQQLQQSLTLLQKKEDMCRIEVAQVMAEHAGAQEELKMATVSCEEIQRKLEESDARLSAQQKRYEQVRTERNQFSKKLVESQDEIVELKHKFKVMDHQISQFKEELFMKDKRYQEETSKQKTASHRLAKARRLVNEFTVQFDEAKVKSETISQQIRQLVKIISLCDKELSEQQQHFLKITNERDLLGSQLIRRNDELALLYEKLRVHQETQSNGEVAYRARLEDLRLLRAKIREITWQTSLAEFRTKDLNPMKKRIRELQHQIAVEQAKVAALAEELETPRHVTRWRKVEGKDLSPEELQKKGAELQKRLIHKSEEALELEMMLHEKTRLVTELQTILSRQPRPEVGQHLNAYHNDLLQKNAQMKQAASEWNMTNTHFTELKYEVQRLRRELHMMKRNYYEIKMQNDEMMNPPLSTLVTNLGRGGGGGGGTGTNAVGVDDGEVASPIPSTSSNNAAEILKKQSTQTFPPASREHLPDSGEFSGQSITEISDTRALPSSD